jgi:hypothetical protein
MAEGFGADAPASGMQVWPQTACTAAHHSNMRVCCAYCHPTGRRPSQGPAMRCRLACRIHRVTQDVEHSCAGTSVADVDAFGSPGSSPTATTAEGRVLSAVESHTVGLVGAFAQVLRCDPGTGAGVTS